MDSKYFLKNIYIFILVILALFMLSLSMFREFSKPKTHEGFTQSSPFVLKQNDAKYDEFYAEIYDSIFSSARRTEYELSSILESTQPDSENSIFLDIGCGTGNIVQGLKQLGFKYVYGIDKSKAMIDYSRQKLNASAIDALTASTTKKSPGDICYKCGDISDPLLYEHNTFTHVTCFYFTIYGFKDKRTFFDNCYSWLKPNGYLFIHLVDAKKFNMIPPIITNRPTEYEDYVVDGDRVRETEIDLNGYKYKVKYSQSAKDDPNSWLFQETFKDSKTSHIRQNEQILYMDDEEEIMKQARRAGFSLHGQIDFAPIGESHQYIYIFQK